MILLPLSAVRNMMNDVIVMAESRDRLTGFIVNMLSGNPVSKEEADMILAKEEECDMRILGHVEKSWMGEGTLEK